MPSLSMPCHGSRSRHRLYARHLSILYRKSLELCVGQIAHALWSSSLSDVGFQPTYTSKPARTTSLPLHKVSETATGSTSPAAAEAMTTSATPSRKRHPFRHAVDLPAPAQSAGLRPNGACPTRTCRTAVGTATTPWSCPQGWITNETGIGTGSTCPPSHRVVAGCRRVGARRL